MEESSSKMVNLESVHTPVKILVHCDVKNNDIMVELGDELI